MVIFGSGGFDKLLEQLGSLAKESHEISIGKAVEDLGLTESHLCGAPYGEANQGWPHCGECSKSMNFVGQLNTGMIEDFPEDGPGLYTFFVCFECNTASPRLPGTPGQRLAGAHLHNSLQTALASSRHAAPKKHQ